VAIARLRWPSAALDSNTAASIGNARQAYDDSASTTRASRARALRPDQRRHRDRAGVDHRVSAGRVAGLGLIVLNDRQTARPRTHASTRSRPQYLERGAVDPAAWRPME